MFKSLLLTATLVIASPVLGALPAYVGSWGDGRDGCRADEDLVPTRIGVDEIEFYDTACDLESVVQKGRTWTAKAVIYPLGEFERRSRVPGTLHYRARREGRVLHDALH